MAISRGCCKYDFLHHQEVGLDVLGGTFQLKSSVLLKNVKYRPQVTPSQYYELTITWFIAHSSLSRELNRNTCLINQMKVSWHCYTFNDIQIWVTQSSVRECSFESLQEPYHNAKAKPVPQDWNTTAVAYRVRGLWLLLLWMGNSVNSLYRDLLLAGL